MTFIGLASGWDFCGKKQQPLVSGKQMTWWALQDSNL